MSAYAYGESGGMHRMRRLHFIGIGGVGMGGIAEVLVNLGYDVSGSDQSANALTARLESMGATVHIGHDATHVDNKDVVIVSTAIAEESRLRVRTEKQRRQVLLPVYELFKRPPIT